MVGPGSQFPFPGLCTWWSKADKFLTPQAAAVSPADTSLMSANVSEDTAGFRGELPGVEGKCGQTSAASQCVIPRQRLVWFG